MIHIITKRQVENFMNANKKVKTLSNQNCFLFEFKLKWNILLRQLVFSNWWVQTAGSSNTGTVQWASQQVQKNVNSEGKNLIERETGA